MLRFFLFKAMVDDKKRLKWQRSELQRSSSETLRSVRPYCARCVSSLCIEIINSLMSRVFFVLIVLTVLIVHWWASPGSMSIKRSELKKGRCKRNY